MEYLCLKCDERQLVPHTCENCGEEPVELIEAEKVRNTIEQLRDLLKEEE